MKKIVIPLICFVVFFGFGCANKEEQAERTYTKAKTLEENNNYQEAINLYNKLLVSYPQTETATRIKDENVLETAYFNMGKFKLATTLENGQQKMADKDTPTEKEFLDLNATIQSGFSAAKADFEYVLQHYPQSQYKSEINQLLETIKTYAPKIEKMLTTKANIMKYVAERKWESANHELNKIRTDIDPETYELLKKQINNARYAPIDSTVNRVINYVGSAVDANGSVLNFEEARKLIVGQGQRVRINAVLWNPRRRSKTVSAYNGPELSGERVDVLYEGTEAENYFMDNEPSSSQTYTIIGRVGVYSNTAEPYIKAESIKLNSR